MSDWKDNLTIVLVDTRNPLNIGAAARAMLNFGFTRLRLVRPYDVAFREARSAAAAAPVLAGAEVFSSLSETLTGCTLAAGTASAGPRVFRQPRHSLPEAAAMLRRHVKRDPAALLFGSEKFGLSNDDLSHCQWTLKIPTDVRCPSMNLGQAVALCCYEIAREKSAVLEEAPNRRRLRRASAEQVERIVDRLTGVLDTSGYFPERTRRSNLLKIRRLVARLELSADDAVVLLGMLRQIGWKLGKES